jgi:hypothetical protein
VVRISADAAQFTAGMRGVVGTAQSTAAAVAGFGSRIEGFAGQVGGAVAAITAGWASGQTFGMLQKWFEMFSSQQETFIRLEATLRSQGVAVDETVAKYREFAAQVAATTTTSASATTSLLTQAATFRAVGATGIAAARDALALSAATGVNAEAVLRLTAAEAQGDTQRAMHMARVLPQLRFIKDQAQFQSEYNKLVAAGTEAQQKLAGTAAGQLTQLGNLWSSVQKQLGSVVADGLKPMVELARTAAGAFGTLSQSAREAVVIVLAVAAAGVAGLAALGAGVFVLGTVFNLSFGGAGILIGLVVTGLGLASAGAVALVEDVGGVKATFEALKVAALAAWDWLLPVRVAVADLWKTVQDVGTRAWAAVKEAAVNAWAALGLGKATWGQVRAAAVDAIIALEFGLTHIQDVSNLAWAGIKYYAVAALDTILENVFLVLQGPGLLAAWAASYVNWSKLFTSVGEVAKNVFLDMSEYAAKFFAAVKLSIEGKAVNWGALFSHTLGTQFEADVKFTATGVVLPQLQATEAALKAEFERVKDSVGVSFDAFRTKKLAEFAAAAAKATQIKQDEKSPPHSWAPAIKEATKALKDMQAVLAGTADDFQTLADYSERLHGIAPAPPPAGAFVAGGAEDLGAEFGGGRPEALPVLRQIRDAVVAQAKKPALDVQAGMGLG